METPLVFDKDCDRRDQRKINIWKQIKSQVSYLGSRVEVDSPTVTTVIGFIPEEGEVCTVDKNLHGVFSNTQGSVVTPRGTEYFGNACEINFLYDTGMTDDQIVDYVVSTVKEMIEKTIEMYKGVVVRNIHVSYHGGATFGCTVTMSSTDNTANNPIAQNTFLMYNPTNNSNETFNNQYLEKVEPFHRYFGDGQFYNAVKI